MIIFDFCLNFFDFLSLPTRFFSSFFDFYWFWCPNMRVRPGLARDGKSATFCFDVANLFAIDTVLRWCLEPCLYLLLFFLFHIIKTVFNVFFMFFFCFINVFQWFSMLRHKIHPKTRQNLPKIDAKSPQIQPETHPSAPPGHPWPQAGQN